MKRENTPNTLKGAVDIHNHLRQGSLAFERNWLTKKFRIRFFMTLLGVIITNAFLMSELEHSTFNSQPDSCPDSGNFTNFLDKLAYQMISKFQKEEEEESAKETSKKSSNSSTAKRG